MKNRTARKLTHLAQEWALLSSEATKIRDRKRKMREELELLFSRIIIPINRELKAQGVWYFFDRTQHAGYSTEGSLSFSLHPRTRRAWNSEDPWGIFVDYDRARELTQLVRRTKAFRGFLKSFPNVTATVDSNLNGNDQPLASIRSILRKERRAQRAIGK